MYDNQDNVDTVRVVVGGTNGEGTNTGSGSTGSGTITNPISDAELLEIEEFIKGLLSEIGGQSVEDNDGVEINQAVYGFYFYWKREKLMIKYEGTKVYNLFKKFQNSLTQAQVTTLNSSITKIETLQQQTKYQTEIWKDFLALIEISIKYELEARDTVVQLDEAQVQADLILYYGEIGLDISGFKSIGGGMGSVATYWVGYINDDPYLEEIAKVHLQEDLVLVAQELNPSKKFKKLQALGEKIRDSKKILTIGGKKIDSTLFHRTIKPDILAQSGNFSSKVGNNPDIFVKNGKIVLLGNGTFKGKSLETDLNFSDFNY